MTRSAGVRSGHKAARRPKQLMSHKVKIPDLKDLKSRFRTGGCTVTDLDETAFEFAQSDFPVRTHVLVNPYLEHVAPRTRPNQDLLRSS